ncbi:MAG: hypothetical protein WD711_09860 [Dongiaceae bacterium]
MVQKAKPGNIPAKFMLLELCQGGIVDGIEHFGLIWLNTKNRFAYHSHGAAKDGIDVLPGCQLQLLAGVAKHDMPMLGVLFAQFFYSCRIAFYDCNRIPGKSQREQKIGTPVADMPGEAVARPAAPVRAVRPPDYKGVATDQQARRWRRVVE